VGGFVAGLVGDTSNPVGGALGCALGAAIGLALGDRDTVGLAVTENVSSVKSAETSRAPTLKSTPASFLFAGVSTASWIAVRVTSPMKAAPACC